MSSVIDQSTSRPWLFANGPLAFESNELIHTTIAVPTFKRPEELDSCLASILSEITPLNPYKVIVVDNNSSDATLSIAAKYTMTIPWLAVYSRNINVGAIKNTMDIVDLVDTKYVLWLTDDDTICSGSLDRLSSVIRSNAKDIAWLLSPLPTYDARTGSHIGTIKPRLKDSHNVVELNKYAYAHYAWAFSRQLWDTRFLINSIQEVKKNKKLLTSGYWMLYPAVIAIHNSKAYFLNLDIVQHVYGNTVHWECIHPNEKKRRARLDIDYIITFTLAVATATRIRWCSWKTINELLSFCDESYRSTPSKHILNSITNSLMSRGKIPIPDLVYTCIIKALYLFKRKHKSLPDILS